jgi:hypothetical protein
MCLVEQEELDAIAEREREIAALQAAQIRDLARLAGRECESSCVTDLLGAELSAPLGHVRNRMSDAATAAECLPRMVELLAAGEIGMSTLGNLIHTILPLSDEHARELDTALAIWICGHTHQQIVAKARRLVLEIDPEGAAERAERRKLDRKVSIEPLDDGMSELAAYLPAEQATAIDERLTHLARQCPAPDERTMDQRRADILADLLLGGQDNYRVNVNVTVPITALLGGDAPGDLAAYGPITAATARELAARDARWRRILTDPADGSVVATEHNAYSPPRALAEHIRIRDRKWAFPPCSANAAKADLDHPIPYPAGKTSAGNLEPLCRRHHRLKHRPGWKLQQPSPGHFIWTTPTGRQYHTRPGPP